VLVLPVGSCYDRAANIRLDEFQAVISKTSDENHGGGLGAA
jgi:hypothetical protein